MGCLLGKGAFSTVIERVNAWWRDWRKHRRQKQVEWALSHPPANPEAALKWVLLIIVVMFIWTYIETSLPFTQSYLDSAANQSVRTGITHERCNLIQKEFIVQNLTVKCNSSLVITVVDADSCVQDVALDSLESAYFQVGSKVCRYTAHCTTENWLAQSITATEALWYSGLCTVPTGERAREFSKYMTETKCSMKP